MLKAYKFRIYPTKSQVSKLGNWLAGCRELYNAALQERRDALKLNRISITYQAQQNTLPEIRQDRPDIGEIHSQVLQDVLRRLDKTFKAFFNRLKRGEKAGYPRFKGKFRYHSFTFSQSGFGLENGKLKLSKLGTFKIKQHRKVVGKVKTLTISRDSCGKWFACFAVETGADERLEPTGKSVGIDVGLTVFATLSDKNKVKNPRFFQTDEKALKQAQQKLSAQAKGTKERHQKRKVVARIHSRIRNRRDNFTHQFSYQLVQNFDNIFFEDLQIKEMMQNPDYAKGIGDVAWKQAIQKTIYKAEKAGRVVRIVNPAYTSQTCSSCRHCEKANRVRQAKFECQSCGIHLNADYNASLNILAVGLHSIGYKSVEATSKRVFGGGVVT